MYKSKRSDRGGERSSSPISKRSRSSLGRYGDPDSDEGSPERGRGGRGSSPGGGGRGGGGRDYYSDRGYKDGHHSSSSTPGGSRPYPYKVLCISSISGKASDDIVRDTLYREFKRFGEISVKVVHEPDERVAYVYFRSYEEAREAKHSKNRILVFDKPAMIEAAYESSTSSSGSASGGYKDGGGGGYGDSRGYGSSSAGGGGGYRRSPHPPQPLPPMYERGHREDHRAGGYEGGRSYHGGPPPPHHPPPHQPYIRPDYRRDPHDYGAGRGGGPHGPPMYPPRYEKYPPYDAPYQRYPPGPPGPRMPGMPPPGPDGHRQPYENKKDKFPNYLQHIAPEDDPLATRTLFAGNLEVSISDEEMKRIFGRYGTVEDIDIKRPPPGTGNAYAFVRFANLDMAARAKSELSGQYIGKFQCKIGYGKVNPTTKIWVGGLGPWTTMKMLDNEFDRFGVMKKIDWEQGDDQAFITYESIDAAQAAVKQMRGFALGGAGKRIRTDFAGVEQIVGYASKYNNAGGTGGSSGANENENGKSSTYEPNNYDNNDKYRNNKGRSSNAGSGMEDDGPVVKSTSSFGNRSPDLGGSSPSDSESTTERKANNKARNGFGTFKSILDIAKRETPGWTGSLILKNSSFPTKLYLTDGDLQSINILMKDEEGKDKLRITQRLRLDESKLEDVTKRMNTSVGHGVFLAMPTSASSGSSPMDSPNAGSSDVQSRPLRSLVSYLKEKTAAGVISLQNKALDLTGVLYAFPPCKFSLDLLQKTCPNIEETKDDYLVVVVIRGGTA